jgi:hypothetical protein
MRYVDPGRVVQKFCPICGSKLTGRDAIDILFSKKPIHLTRVFIIFGEISFLGMTTCQIHFVAEWSGMLVQY